MATKRINQLTQAATEADLVVGTHFAVDTQDGTKRLPAEVVAKASDVGAVSEKKLDLARSIRSVNFAHFNGLTLNTYVRTNGSLADYDGWNSTDFLSIVPGEYVFRPIEENGRNTYYACYDSNFICVGAGNAQPGNLQKIIVPETAKYIRLSADKKIIFENSMWMLLPYTYYSNAPTKYIPYSADFVGNEFDAKEKFESLQDAVSQSIQISPTIATSKIYKVLDWGIQEQSGSSYAIYKSAVIDVHAGETYFYTGKEYNYANQYSVILADANGKVLRFYFGKGTDESAATSHENTRIDIPKGATKLYLQSYSGNLVVRKLSLSNIGQSFDEVRQEIDSLDSKVNRVTIDYNKIVRSIQRIGAGYGQHNSVLAFKKAYKAGWRIITADLLFTSDGVPVCCHDHYINQYENVVYDANGVKVPTTNPVYIKDNTWATLSTYDFGKEYGAEFVGGKLPRLDEVCDLCKRLGIELYIEVKEMGTQEQANAAAKIVRNHGISKQTSWACGTTTQCQMVLNAITDARVGTMPSTLTTSIIDGLIALKNEKNKVFIFGWDTTQLTESIVSRLADNSIEFEMGTPTTAQAIIDYYNQGEVYKYCTGIQCNTIIAGKVVHDNYMA